MYTKIDWPTVSLIGASAVKAINVGASMNLYSYLPCHIYCPIYVKSGIIHLHVMLLGIFDSRENRRKEGGAFLMGANDIVFTDVPSNRMEF